MCKVYIETEARSWDFRSTKYAKAAMNNVEDHLKNKREVLTEHAIPLLSFGYHIDINMSQDLCLEEVSCFRSLIGILWWMVEIGSVDICCEV